MANLVDQIKNTQEMVAAIERALELLAAYSSTVKTQQPSMYGTGTVFWSLASG